MRPKRQVATAYMGSVVLEGSSAMPGGFEGHHYSIISYIDHSHNQIKMSHPRIQSNPAFVNCTIRTTMPAKFALADPATASQEHFGDTEMERSVGQTRP
jgi:hypothetical protein